MLGRAIHVGPYEIRVTMKDERTVGVSASTNDPSAAGIVPLCFLDEKHRPLFAPTIALETRDGLRQGSVAIRGSTDVAECPIHRGVDQLREHAPSAG